MQNSALVQSAAAVTNAYTVPAIFFELHTTIFRIRLTQPLSDEENCMKIADTSAQDEVLASPKSPKKKLYAGVGAA